MVSRHEEDDQLKQVQNTSGIPHQQTVIPDKRFLIFNVLFDGE